VYLTVDQAQARNSGGLERALQFGRVAAAHGLSLDVWESAHSLRAGVVCLTAWWESLADLEAASNALRYVELNEDPDREDGTQSPSDPVVQRLLTVVSGPTRFDHTHKYLRILEVSGLKDMQTAVDNGVEHAEKVSNTTGISMTVLRNVTGFSRDMMFLSTYESLAQYEEAGHHLQATSYWLHQRSQYGKDFDASTLTMNLFRRIDRD
jgi:hypothetical protein